MHVPEGNILHLPFMGHPNTWQVHVGVVVHVGMCIRCFQALCIPSLPTLPRQEELFAVFPCNVPLSNWEGWCSHMLQLCAMGLARACWHPPYFRGTWSGSSWQGVKPVCPTGMCWDDGDALTWSLLPSLPYSQQVKGCGD